MVSKSIKSESSRKKNIEDYVIISAAPLLHLV